MKISGGQAKPITNARFNNYMNISFDTGNLKKRVLTSIALVTIIITLVAIHAVTFVILLLIINLLTLSEFYRLFLTNEKLLKVTACIFSAVLLIVTAAVSCRLVGWQAYLPAIPVGFAFFIMQLFSHDEKPFTTLAFMFLGITCITIPLCCMEAAGFLSTNTGTYQRNFILWWFVIIWVSDTAAYFTGSILGRHKLFYRMSPHKTWEGSAGALACSLLAAVSLPRFDTGISAVTCMVLGLIIVVFGTLGDLVKSMMKRSLGIKDAGKILPGHGGMLDRFDSLLGSAPFVFTYFALYK